MRIVFGLLGLVIVAAFGFMYQTKRLSGLHKDIPGIPGTKISDLDPRKIVNTYKETLGDLEKRNKVLMSGELDEDKLKALAHVEGGAPPSTVPVAGVAAVSKSAPRATRIFRYGMDLEKLSAEEAKPFLGTWAYASADPKELPVRMSLRPDGAISSVSVKLQPNINASMGDNSTPLWKNTKTGQIIVLAGDKDYIAVTTLARGLRGTLFRQGADGVTYVKLLEFPLKKY